MKINGKSLKLALRGAGITQEEAAKRLNVTRQTVGNWVKYDELDADILQKVKHNLGIDLQNVNTEGNRLEQERSNPYHIPAETDKKVIDVLLEQIEFYKKQIAELKRQAETKGK